MTPTNAPTRRSPATLRKTGDEPLVTASEVASLLSLSPSTVLDWFEAGKLPGFKLGDGAAAPVRFRESEVLAWLESKRSGCGT